jgi:hypothetical protein
MKRVLLATAVSAALAVSASAVLAQSTPEPHNVLVAAATDATGTTGNTAQPRHFRSASERVEARIARIQQALQITSAQQPQFDTFANVLRKQAQAMDQRIQERRAQMQQGAAPTNLTAIQRLEFMQRVTANRYNQLGEVIAAAKPLYDTLSPEQKQAADQLLARRGRHGPHGHHRPA